MTARRFRLIRHHDVSGVSGTGPVAEGVQFTDGAVALRWYPDYPTTTVWDSIESVIAIHGHQGATEVEWYHADPGPDPDLNVRVRTCLPKPGRSCTRLPNQTTTSPKAPTALQTVRPTETRPRPDPAPRTWSDPSGPARRTPSGARPALAVLRPALAVLRAAVLRQPPAL